MGHVLPAYRGPQPRRPISLTVILLHPGHPGHQRGVDELGLSIPLMSIHPGAVERASDIPAGYLTRRLANFDFDSMVNRQASAPQAAGEPLS